MSGADSSGVGFRSRPAVGIPSSARMNEQSLALLEQALEPASREILDFLREVRHATIEELRELIGEPCHMNVLTRIEDDINRQAERVLGAPVLAFEECRADPETHEQVPFSWWLTREAETLASPRAAPDIAADVFVEDRAIVVIAQLPGAREGDIRVAVESERLVLTADAPGCSHYQEIPLPAAVRAGRCRTQYNNQVLRVQLEREHTGDPF